MRYIARLSPAPNPLQATCYGDNLETLRDWLRVMPTGSRADVYEMTEVHIKTYTKEENNVVTETLVRPPAATTERPLAKQQEPSDESVTKTD
jgi:hypothetical protein